MNTRSRSGLFVCVSLVATVCAEARAEAVAGGPKKAGVGEGAPLFLHQLLEKKVERRKEKDRADGSEANAACRKALDAGDAAAVQKHCKHSPGVSQLLDESKPRMGKGRNGDDVKVGREVHRKTRFRYDKPSQRDGHDAQDRWERMVVRPPAQGDVKSRTFRERAYRGGVPGSNRDRSRVHALLAAAGTASRVNDDKDCVETATGRHLRGDGCFDAEARPRAGIEELFDEDPASPRSPDGGAYDVDGDGLFGDDPPGNGNEDGDCVDTVSGLHLRGADCFANPDAPAAQRTLLQNLAELPAVGCRWTGRGGEQKVFEGVSGDGQPDFCHDANDQPRTTTLAQLTDEDDGRAVDDDGDGLVDEDGPEETGSFAEQCAGIGAAWTGDGCDLTDVIVRKVNEKARGQAGVGQDVYRNPDSPVAASPDEPGSGKQGPVEYGSEERELELDETVTIDCEEGSVLTDDDQCVPEAQLPALLQARAALAASPNGSAQPLREKVMMGFTFAPPRIRWGLFYKEEACFWIFGCFTLFEAKAGFDFALGLGFRLPAEVTVGTGAAELPVPAGQDVSLASTIEPLDFSAEDYRAFCARQQLGDAAYCERFSFPNALVPDQGDELVLRATAFAGIKLVVVEIPIIDFGIDLDADVAEWCSLGLAYLNWQDVALQLARDPSQGLNGAIDAAGFNCGSYTTPFGHDDNGNPRQFPFIEQLFNIMIRADCAEAFVRGETIMVDGAPVPLCTGFILGVPGASLGLGLGAQLEVSSQRIDATLAASGDGKVDAANAAVQYLHSKNEPGSEIALGPVNLDNHDPAEGHDSALVTIGGFTYCLNTFSVALKGQPMFGGLLSILPEFDDFTIYRYTIPGTGCGIPIGQHAGTSPVQLSVPVLNHALELKVHTVPGAPGLVDEKTLEVKPGQPGTFAVDVKNLGSVSDSFGNFALTLSNRRDQAWPYLFGIVPDNDGDGRVDEDGPNPGKPVAERDDDHDGAVDEDPYDDWRASPASDALLASRIFDVQPYETSTGGLAVSITPFAYPLTRPGLYPFEVKADSMGAVALGWTGPDASGQPRRGASDFGLVRVSAFREAHAMVTPPAVRLLPGQAQAYVVEATNMGNVDDTLSVGTTFLDSNAAGCSLAQLGAAGCPYRAEPTRIDAAAWTDVSTLEAQFGPLAPLGVGSDRFSVTVPRDWKGMRDTVYAFEVTISSPARGADPAVSSTARVEHTVVATKESMTRFLQFEVKALIASIEAANAQGLKTGGALPVALHPLLGKVEQALALTLSGSLDKASGPLTSAGHVVGAFQHALAAQAPKLPAELATDWRSRADAIGADLATAAACQVAAVP